MQNSAGKLVLLVSYSTDTLCKYLRMQTLVKLEKEMMIMNLIANQTLKERTITSPKSVRTKSSRKAVSMLMNGRVKSWRRESEG